MYVKYSYIASSGRDHKKAGRSRVPGQLLSWSTYCPGTLYLRRDCVSSPCARLRPSVECSVVWVHAHAHLDLTNHGHITQRANQQNRTSEDVFVGHTPPPPLLSRAGIMWVKKDATTFFPGHWGNSRAPVRTSKVTAMLCYTPWPPRQAMFEVERVHCLLKFLRGTQSYTKGTPASHWEVKLLIPFHGHDHKLPLLTQNHNFYLLDHFSLLDFMYFCTHRQTFRLVFYPIHHQGKVDEQKSDLSPVQIAKGRGADTPAMSWHTCPPKVYKWVGWWRAACVLSSSLAHDHILTAWLPLSLYEPTWSHGSEPKRSLMLLWDTR